jgi:cation-transporting P-type ATPase I
VRPPFSALVVRASTLAVAPVAIGLAVTATAVETGLRIGSSPARAAARIASRESLEFGLRVARELVGGTPGRRCWTGPGRCWIEVRGLQSDDGRRVGTALLRALRAADGVASAQLNYPLSRVVVDLAEPRPPIAELCNLVAEVEAHVLPSNGPESAPPTNLPADGVVLAGKLIATAANGVGLCLATAGRVFMWPSLPGGLSAAVTLVDYQPKLRDAVEARLGQDAADAVLAVAAATVYAITQAPATVAVELIRHLAQIGEAVAAARAWEAYEPQLAAGAQCIDAIPKRHRPRPLPPGMVERHAARSGAAQGLAALAVGLLTRNPNAAATAAVVTAPKAARNAREAFASTLGRGLADEHGVLPLRSAALRLLDRVDAVVVDPRVLLIQSLRIGQIRDVAERDRSAVWQSAQDALERGELDAGWHRVPPKLEGARTNGAPRGEVFVRNTHHPLAHSVLAEIRSAGVEVVSVDVDQLDDLRSSFDELWTHEGDFDAALAGAVDDLQRDGKTVAVLATDAPLALKGADVAVGLIDSNGAPPWYADLLVGDLEGMWRILHALTAARKASRRGVELATSGTLLGALLMIPGVGGRGPGPVVAGAGAGLATGYSLARGALRGKTPTPAPVQDWHAMSPDRVRTALSELNNVVPVVVSQSTASRAKRRAGAVGESVRRPVGEFLTVLRGELSDPLTPVLAVGSAASALLGSPVDAVLVGSVLTGNALLAATQEVRAERLLRRLLAVQDPPARRLVDGRAQDVATARLRPGDVIEVRPGEVVPADARIVEATDLEADESALTGESLPVPKQVDATPGAVLAERSCMLHAGTTVVAGSATAIVTTVGAQTQVRRAAEVPRTEGSTVGLKTQLRDLTNQALPFGLAGGALVSGLGMLRLFPLRQAVASGVAVAVAAVPEGLPLVATLAQQASARRLTRAGALVRSPRSVEALGRIDVVCFDKTGTLSENRLRVTSVETAQGHSRGDVLACAGRATPASNGARHEHATDAAIAEAASAVGADDLDDAAHLPFRSGRPFSASVAGDELSVKGAPEVVLAGCVDLLPADEKTVAEMARAGLRVIAVASRTLTAKQAARVRDDTDHFAALSGSDLRLVGLLGLSDTPREQSAGVLKSLQERQIGVRLITGDHPVTATAIAAELGLAVTAEQVISGSEWDVLPRRGQERAVRDRVVFARMSPEHKVQIVQTLERSGLVCAMVGDGANDAAAIRAATVGIGVASRGSDPARTSADVMLLDGRIGALLDCLDEGRQLWRRVEAAVSVLLGGNAGEVAFAIVGSALTGRSPLNTRQLLLVNMMTDALPAAALAVSPTANSADDRSGHGPDRAALWRTVAIRGTTTAGAATAAWLMSGFTLSPRRASTVSLVALVSTQLGQTLIDSHSPLVVATAAGSLLSLGALISTPGISQLLGCTPIGPIGWTQALGTAAAATAAAAVAPRLLGAAASSMSTTPILHSTAYSSRNGMDSRRATTVTGSDGVLLTEPVMGSTLEKPGVEKPKTT